MVSRMLSRHPDVLSVSELFSSIQPHAFPTGALSGKRFWRILAEPQDAWTSVLRERIEPSELTYPVDAGGRFNRQTGIPPIAAICLPTLTDNADAMYGELEDAVMQFPVAPVGDHYRALFSWLARRLGNAVWVERSGGSLQYVRAIMHHFPGARILHLHRDGRETALLMSRHPFFRRQLQAELGRRGMAQAEIPLERFALRWSANILNGTGALASLPAANVRHLSYEQLVAAPEAELSRILAFFELTNPSPEWLTQAVAEVRRRPTRWTSLPASERARLERACAVGERRRQQLAKCD